MVARKIVWKLLKASLVMYVPLIGLSEANSESNALYALRASLSDPNNVLYTWDPTLVDPCTWNLVTCNQDNQVTRLDVCGYNLSGHLVPELGTLENLKYLELYGNKFEGTIPSELGNLKNLISLDLYNNSLTGDIPPSLGNLNSLNFLRLNNNELTGRVPDEVKSLPNLRILDVSGNHIIGE